MSDHARLSPSAADRWFACPASVKACEQYPDDEQSSAALDGTRTHLLLEHCLKTGVSPLDMVGEGMSSKDVEAFTIDRERAMRVRIALDYILSRKDKLNATLIAERKVDAGIAIGRDDINGTADVTLIGEDTIEIIDYKDGRSPINPVGNKQMSIYAIGALVEMTQEQQEKIETVVLTIIQPKLNLPVSSWVTNRDELQEFASRMKEAAERTDKEDAEFVAGEKQCQWCRHKGNCSAYISYSTGGGISKVINIAVQDTNDMTDDQLADIIKKAPEIKKMLEAVEKEALRRMQEGAVINGLKVIKTSGRRKWVLPDEEIATKLQRMGIPKSVSIVKKIVSPAQVEKLTWVKGGEEKKLSERQLNTLMSEYVELSGGSMKVVPADKPGEMVTMNLSHHFSKTENIIEGESENISELPNWLN